MEKNYYITFENHEQAIMLLGELRAGGHRAVIAPTPREISMCCGVCVMVREDEIEAVRKHIEQHDSTFKSIEGVVQQFNPNRDRYL